MASLFLTLSKFYMLKRSSTEVSINLVFMGNKRNPPYIITIFPIPKLSLLEDYKQSGEGVITFDGSKVLNSFALNKAPGNYGLPILRTLLNFLELGWRTFKWNLSMSRL